jgi:hypothetical protein
MLEWGFYLGLLALGAYYFTVQESPFFLFPFDHLLDL